MTMAVRPTIAVLLPCYNEEAAIAKTVAGFRAALPDAVIYVYDNNSRDGTVAAARAAGAVVRTERMQGKGHVVRRMFADIDADVYVWRMAISPTIPRPRRRWSTSSWRKTSTWSSALASMKKRTPTAAGMFSGTSCSPAFCP